MPKKAKELSGLVVSRLKSEGMYAVGGVDGLYLRIQNQFREHEGEIMPCRPETAII
ncbi:hypothetical protein O5287_29390 [Escherichia coli]|nr:hypothetical protein [Escherichia coli]